MWKLDVTDPIDLGVGAISHVTVFFAPCALQFPSISPRGAVDPELSATNIATVAATAPTSASTVPTTNHSGSLRKRRNADRVDGAGGGVINLVRSKNWARVSAGRTYPRRHCGTLLQESACR
ncbi:hypothetical protein Vau01_066310 [Virgisporangium aurantiacum]|uniref:Uncharacterized protein n=1 Tax=Virgisporangium aurantiacum TaxID=175570 RepID=A0A8J3ZCE0_9ACTN|nr:hypothetical protein Vau01_066310 [Virgisporangium aurantiacum]